MKRSIFISLLIVLYLTFLGAISAVDSTTSGQTDLQKEVEEKISKALDKPKALLGVVTDIVEANIQLKSEDQQIRQIATDKNLTLVKMGKTSETVSFSDLAIGDYISALGYYDDKEILLAKRILITKPSVFTREVVLAEVSGLAKNKLTLRKVKEDEDLDVTLPKNLSISAAQESKTKIQAADIKEGAIVLAVIIHNGEAAEVRSIHIVFSPSPTP